MPETSKKGSFSVYTDEQLIEDIDDSNDYTRSEAVTEALESWVSENINN